MDTRSQRLATPIESSNEVPFARQAWVYVAIAFGLSWSMTILGIKLHAKEEFLNFGTAGPAFAAMILSRRGRSNSSRGHAPRWVWFFAFLLLCWSVLALHYLWRVAANSCFAWIRCSSLRQYSPRGCFPVFAPATWGRVR
jgi:hypothetical protein